MQQDPYRFSKDGFMEQPVCRRLRSNLRPQMPIMPDHKADEKKPSLEDDLLGKDGLGLSTEEFSNLGESERNQLLEAVLQSKEDFKLKERKTEVEKPISSLGSSKHQASTSSLLCSVPIENLKLTVEPLGRITARPSLERFRLNPASVAATEVKDSAVTDLALTASRSTAGAANSDLGNWNKTISDESKSEENIPAAATRKELIWDQSYLSPVKPLIRKYRVQVVDKRPMFCRPKGLSKVEHVRMIWNYMTEMEELLCQQSRSTRKPLVPWGKPIPIEVSRTRQSTRTKNPVNAVKNDVGYLGTEFEEKLTVQDINGTEQGQNFALNTNEDRLNTNEGRLNTNEARLNTSDRRFSANEDLSNANEGRSDQASEVEARSSLAKAGDIVLSSRWKQEEIDSRLQNSRQMKIGGGVAEEGPPKVQRKTVKRRTVKEGEETSDKALSSKAKSGKQKKPGNYVKKLPHVIIRKNKNNAEEVKDDDIVAAEESSSILCLSGVSRDQASGGLPRGNSYKENIEECNSDVEFVAPSPTSGADHRAPTELLQSSALDRLERPSIREYASRKRKNAPSTSSRNSIFQNPELHYDLFSDDDFPVDDGKKAGRRKEPDPDFVLGKTSSKKQVKPGNEQLTMKSFSAFSSSLPKVQKLTTKTCPMCQTGVPESEYKDHVQECVDRCDSQSRTRRTSHT